MKRYREAYYEAAEMILQTKEVTASAKALNAKDLMSAHVLSGSEAEAEPKMGDCI
jgi:hypothetical protein